MSKILDSISKTSGQVGNATKGIFGNKEAAQTALDSVQTVAAKGPGPVSKAFGVAGSAITWPARKAFQGGMYVASRPFVWADSIGGKVISGYGNMFARNPKTVLAGTVAVGALGVGHMMNKRSERDAQNQINELEMAQLRASQAQAQANTVTPAEYAAMEARMRQGGQNGGFAAGVKAERAAQASQTPAV